MAQTSINIRIDEADKKEFDALCSQMGLTMSAAYNLFTKAVLQRRGIPFEVRADEPNDETLAAMREVEDMEAHPERYTGYTDLDQMWGELLK